MSEAVRESVTFDDRVERLLNKAEGAIDRGEIEKADTYAALASRTAYLRRKEAREMNRRLEVHRD